MSAPDPRWLAANQALLTARFADLHRRLAGRLGQPAPDERTPDLERLRAAMPAVSTLDRLAEVFALDAFALDLVLLTAAVELDGRIARQVAELNGGSGHQPTIAAAFQALDGAHWSALGPAAPLRRWRLVEVEGDGRFTAKALRLDERILHFLLGAPAIDPRIEPLLHPLPKGDAPDAEAVARGLETPGVVLVTGRDPWVLAATVGAAAGARREAWRLDLGDLPSPPFEREPLARLLARELRLSGGVLAVACDETDEASLRGLAPLLRRLERPVAVLARAPVALGDVPAARVEVAGLGAAARADLLRRTCGRQRGIVAAVEPVAAQFDLPATALEAAARRALDREPGTALAPALWAAARAEARPRLDDLAERIEPKAVWADLILPAERMAVLKQIAAQVGQRIRVYDQWGFRDRLQARGLGITALFAGPSGTGKTLAAEVVASALSLDLYRIDLSAVVSKYIGETEKNLRRIFDAAEVGGAVLLFDEADALFGKRSEVKDSHDRYANIEVGYLLQRMESYGGLAILTTNMKQNLDQAFMRRLRFVVDFPFPGAAERAAIWATVFPEKLPKEAFDARQLARMNLAGGAIRNVALNAAFLAAADGGMVKAEHLLAAARSEYAKLEKPLTASEVKGWAGLAP
jgi:hypothetical protein